MLLFIVYLLTATGCSAVLVARMQRVARISLLEPGISFADVAFVYSVAPLLAFTAYGTIDLNPFFDNRLSSIQPSPADLAYVGWIHFFTFSASLAAYLALRKSLP